MLFDPDKRMSPDDIRAGARRVAWISPVIFLVFLVLLLHQGVSAGYALLASIGVTAAPWVFILPIVIWGGRAVEGLGTLAAILRIFGD